MTRATQLRLLATAILAGLSVATLAAPASAQAPTLPAMPPGEARAGAINQSLSTQNQNLGAAQQNQFEINALRNQRPIASPPPVSTTPGYVPGAVIR